MMSRIKKIAGLVLFFALLGNTAVFAQETEQKISDQELSTFTNVFEKLQSANAEAQQKMLEVVKSEGLEMKRFNEIHIAYINPNMKSDATPEEMKKHHRAMEKIEKMQEALQDRMDKIVKETGMSTKKYQKIAADLQVNMALRDRYKKMAQAKKEE